MDLHLTIDGFGRNRDLEGWKKPKWNEEDTMEENNGSWLEVLDNNCAKYCTDFVMPLVQSLVPL